MYVARSSYYSKIWLSLLVLSNKIIKNTTFSFHLSSQCVIIWELPWQEDTLDSLPFLSYFQHKFSR